MKISIVCLAVVTVALLNSLVLVVADTILYEKNGKERLTVPIEWCEKISLRDVMLEMKETSAEVTRNLLHSDWDLLYDSSARLKALYDGLKLDNTNVPDDYWEFNEDYLRYFNRFLKASKDKDKKQSDYQLKRVKTACHHCHIRYVRRKQPDDGIALERLYKDQFKKWGDGKSYNTTTDKDGFIN
ncbi:MAG: hypothetical protein ACUZ8E_08845 [Candidatus Anammoxibacter sp.]